MKMDGKQVEILIDVSVNWDERNVLILGVNPPVKIRMHEIVSSKDKQALYTIGNSEDSNNKDIFKFACTNTINDCKWTKAPTQLQHGRYFTVAIPIPEALVNKYCSKYFKFYSYEDLKVKYILM